MLKQKKKKDNKIDSKSQKIQKKIFVKIIKTKKISTIENSKILNDRTRSICR